ncbi:uncharacterized protein cubi_01177 [Cryptosporidium ubiquitum]|uniref:Uncharacterized protein n=1 Tax=Cryptosporidium ubiquitum TaxID=857276 RepID=A0A1J4MN79_9CRYT|nr:uncharacterized protein cubi_01177 [Cryptosporidium ubiquitum]OII74333.1 hypothetical protein cubi_01177 [Cryptosporidium ubiquitum]
MGVSHAYLSYITFSLILFGKLVFSIDFLDREDTYCNENNISDLICVPKDNILQVIDKKIENLKEKLKIKEEYQDINTYIIFNQLEFVKNPLYSCSHPKSKLIELDNIKKTFICIVIEELQKVLQCKSGYELTEVLIENPSKKLGYGESEIRPRTNREKKYAIKSDKLCIKTVKVPVEIICKDGKLKDGFCVREEVTNPLYECPKGLHVTPRKWCGYIKRELNESLMENVIKRTNPGCVIKTIHPWFKSTAKVECYNSNHNYIVGITEDDWVNVVPAAFKCPKDFEIIFPTYSKGKAIDDEFIFPPVCLARKYFPRSISCPGILLRNGLIVTDRYIVDNEVNPTPFKQYIDVSHYSCQVQDRVKPNIVCPIINMDYYSRLRYVFPSSEYYLDSHSNTEKAINYQSGIFDFTSYSDFLSDNPGILNELKEAQLSQINNTSVNNSSTPRDFKKDQNETGLPIVSFFNDSTIDGSSSDGSSSDKPSSDDSSSYGSSSDGSSSDKPSSDDSSSYGSSSDFSSSDFSSPDSSASSNYTSSSNGSSKSSPYYNYKAYKTELHEYSFYYNDTLNKHLKSMNDYNNHEYSYYPFRLNTTLDNPWNTSVSSSSSHLRREEHGKLHLGHSKGSQIEKVVDEKHFNREYNNFIQGLKKDLSKQGEYFNDYQWDFMSKFYRVYVSNQLKFVSNIPVSSVSHKALTIDGGYQLNINLDPTYQSFVNYTLENMKKMDSELNITNLRDDLNNTSNNNISQIIDKLSILNDTNITSSLNLTKDNEYNAWEKSARIYFMDLDLMKKNQIIYSSINNYKHKRKFPFLYYYGKQPSINNDYGHVRRPAISDHKYRYGSPSEDYHKYTGRHENSDLLYYINKHLNKTKPYRHSPGPQTYHNCISINETTPIIECPNSNIVIPKCFILDIIYSKFNNYKDMNGTFTEDNNELNTNNEISEKNGSIQEEEEKKEEEKMDMNKIINSRPISIQEGLNEIGDLEVLGSLEGSGDILNELGYFGNIGELQNLEMLGNLEGPGQLEV